MKVYLGQIRNIPNGSKVRFYDANDILIEHTQGGVTQSHFYIDKNLKRVLFDLHLISTQIILIL